MALLGRGSSQPQRLVMVVDDEQGAEIIFSKIFADLNCPFRFFSSVEEALPILKDGTIPDVLFLDIRLPGIDGLSAIPKFLDLAPKCRIVMMTAYQTVESVVTAMKSGAVDFLIKPLNPQLIKNAIEKYASKTYFERSQAATSQSAALAELSPKKQSSRQFLAHSPMMKNILSIADKFAVSDGLILILGESGCGKERLAHYVHEKSQRKGGPFVVVDCTSIPESLFESELFGYEKGAFTGADVAKTGRFEMAEGGTLFLDEIGNVPLPMQAKLLRFLEDHTITRLGGRKPILLNLRLLAATNENLQKAIQKGNFRQDLYFRLAALTIHLPPLRNRPREEKEFFVRHLLDRNAEVLNSNHYSISEKALKAIYDYSWPGNVRELENALYSACLLANQAQIDLEHLPVGIQSYIESRDASSLLIENPVTERSLKQILEDVEKDQIAAALQQTRGNKRKASEILDMDYKNLLSKIKKYSLDASSE